MNKLTSEQIRTLSSGRLLDLHLAASGSGHVLIYEDGGLRAVLLRDLRETLKRPPFKATVQRFRGTKTSHGCLPYGHTQCDEVEQKMESGAVMLVQYAPDVPLEYTDVTEQVLGVLQAVTLDEVFGIAK